MGKLGKPKRAPRPRDESSDSDSGNVLAKLREERRLVREEQEAEKARAASEASEAARVADAARKQREAMEARIAEEEAARAAKEDTPRCPRDLDDSDEHAQNDVTGMSDAEFLASLGLDATDLESTNAPSSVDFVEEVPADAEKTIAGPVMEKIQIDSKKPASLMSSPDSDLEKPASASGSEGCLQIGVLGEVLLMRLDRETITVAELIRYWQTAWGIQYAAKLNCMKFDAETGRERRLGNLEEITTNAGDVIKIGAGAGAASVVSALSVALKRYQGKNEDEVKADRAAKAEQLHAAASSSSGKEFERFQREEARRERWSAQIARRFEVPAGNVMARVQLERWNPATSSQSRATQSRNQIRLPSRVSSSEVKNFILPGT